LLFWAVFFIAVAIGFVIVSIGSVTGRIFFAIDGMTLLASTLLWVRRLVNRHD